MKTTIYLVRHGETAWNKEKRLQGQKDIPLTDLGIKQAQALAERIKKLKITKIYSSKLSRAINTAKIITEHLDIPIIKLKSLNEISYGEFEGRSRQEMVEEIKKLNIQYYEFTPKKGESNKQFKSRTVRSFKRIVKKNLGEKVLIVSHAAVMHAITRHIRKTNYQTDDSLRFSNTCISIYHFTKDNIIEEMVADSSHLE